MNIQEQRAALMDTLADMLDGLVSSISIDAQLVRPAAGKVAVAELQGFGWSDIRIERAGEVTNADALPDDFRDAMANALTWGCGLIIYDEP